MAINEKDAQQYDDTFRKDGEKASAKSGRVLYYVSLFR
jgi:predicted lipoprotein with Yx(FWY)xxD motif